MVPRVHLRKWLSPSGRMQPWIDAFMVLDRKGDKEPLLHLLTSEKYIPRDARWHLADLLKRYQLKRPRGGRATPSYDRSAKEAPLIWADDSVRQDKSGRSVDEAVERAAKTYGVDPERLHAYRQGKNSSVRRMKKRRSPIR